MSKTAAASTKKAGPGKKTSDAAPSSNGATRANPALKWQLGGLIAGILVALISTTEPGQQVREREEKGGLSCPFPYAVFALYCGA